VTDHAKAGSPSLRTRERSEADALIVIGGEHGRRAQSLLSHLDQVVDRSHRDHHGLRSNAPDGAIVLSDILVVEGARKAIIDHLIIGAGRVIVVSDRVHRLAMEFDGRTWSADPGCGRIEAARSPAEQAAIARAAVVAILGSERLSADVTALSIDDTSHDAMSRHGVIPIDHAEMTDLLEWVSGGEGAEAATIAAAFLQRHLDAPINVARLVLGPGATVTWDEKSPVVRDPRGRVDQDWYDQAGRLTRRDFGAISFQCWRVDARHTVITPLESADGAAHALLRIGCPPRTSTWFKSLNGRRIATDAIDEAWANMTHALGDGSPEKSAYRQGALQF
jgi:hypothetical protein